MNDVLTAHDGEIAHALGQSDGFQLLARSLPDALLVLRPDGRVIYASLQSQDYFGCSAESLVGHPFIDLVTPDDRSTFTEPPTAAAVGTWDFRSARSPDRWLNAAFLSPVLQGFRGTTLDQALGDCTLVLVRDLPRESESVRDRTDLLRRALDATNNLVVVTDATAEDNPLVVVNERFLETTGYSREEVVGQNCRFLQRRGDGTRDDDQDAVRELVEAVREERPTHVVLRNYRKSGEMFYNELFISPVRNREGRVVNFVGVQNDVTERVLAERDALTQPGLLRAFFDGTPLLMGVLERDDAGLVHRTANARAIELYGVAPSKVAGARSSDIGFTARESDRWGEAVERCVAEGGAVQFETAHPWDSEPGSEGTRSLVVTVSPVSDKAEAERGELFSYVGEDVTLSRRSERERELLAAAVDQAAEAIMVTDSDLEVPGPRILYANKAHERIFGYTLEEIVGQSPRLFQGPKTDRVALDRIRRDLKAGRPTSAETINYRKDGTEFVLQWEIAPVEQDGEVRYWVGTQRDVTDQRSLEAEVLEAATREQERIARDLHDGLGQVLTGASFRLQALRTALGRPGPDLEAVAADLERTQELVAGALSQARTVARGLSPADVAQGGLITALDALATDAAEAYGIACTFEADAPIEIASPDGDAHLYRIVQEALANAARHGHADTIAIGVVHTPGALELTVCDDGVGISESDLEGSTGLGLRSMKYRANRLNGTLDLEAAEGGGTVVRVRVPSALRAKVS